ncbi:tRNA (adenosine(37)-N6)-threonylcarbamoyltransferase complex transferase subunit TsaD [Frigidibacter sp. MR17.24]|uniref:tRNA (adenosine(37)-N6)-threonylcarbamoyltransferase complex transferase subunit TsaD n=1 Tax=Frigidibacter sp. MR17.24 TaxID=3127345 RepID=UPI003012C4C1
MAGTITFLGLESSCDDTAAAVVRLTGAGPEILSSVVSSQTELHAEFGGVVPEIAARAHVEKLDLCVEQALEDAGLSLSDVDGIAVTAGPGLIGGVMAGVMCAKGLAIGSGKPLVGVNHLAGHALTPRLTDGLAFPYLMLLVSGGHCQFLLAEGPERFRRLGGTIDDAPGEAFDKTAKLMGLPQPGGPSVERAAAAGDAGRFDFPRPLMDRPGCDMSFSGLKTALMRARDAAVAEAGGLTERDRADLCAGFQEAVAAVLAGKARRALKIAFDQQVEGGDIGTPPVHPPYTAAARHRAQDQGWRPMLAVAGGVAANARIRAALEAVAAEAGAGFVAPPLRLCTDNAAMIAWAGIERFRTGARDGLDLAARPRWPLDDRAAPMLGAGKRGAKA